MNLFRLKMKKGISILLAVLLLVACVLPASAWTDPSASRSQIPVIRISGDGEPLYNAQGERIMHFRGFLEDNGENDDNSALYESIGNVLMPFLREGILFNQWDNYYAALQTEIGEIFGDALLDCNGEPLNGTGLSQSRIEEIERMKKTDKKQGKGYYGIYDYWFNYDWRLDPLYTADLFNDFIKAIKETTNSEKVCIISSCLGTSVVTAYIAKYGCDDIHGIAFDGGVSYGSEAISEAISGKFAVNGEAIERVLIDCANYGLFDVGSFVMKTIDLATASGLLDGVVGITKATLYYRIAKGVTSALALSTFYTWPSYWSAVTSEDFDAALKYVFGEEGSEKRTQYAGLIEKIVNYDEVVRQHIPEIMASIKESGANLAIMAKYGSQMIPVCQSADMVSDQIASVYRASFGAKTSRVCETLSEGHIAKQTANGLGKYISPDKQIDASFCMFPDYTWFVKGATHSNWTSYEMKILYEVVTADTQLTVDDFQETQFIVYNTEKDEAYPMDEENCNTEAWSTQKPMSLLEKITAFFNSLIAWFKELFALLKK